MAFHAGRVLPESLALVSSNETTPQRDAVQQGVVVVIHRAGRFLVIRRAPGILAGGAWCFVGGAIKPGETQQQAVAREFAEEVGGRVQAERKIWEYRRSDGKLVLHWWLARMEDKALALDPLEVAEMRWCTPAEVEALPRLLESNLQFIREVGQGLLGSEGG